MTRAPTIPVFVSRTVLKRDHFSETIEGHAQGNPEHRLLLRRLGGLPWYTRWLGWQLARREIAGLRAVTGIEGVPDLLRVDREGILRDWTAGTPLHRAKPKNAAFYRDAKRLLREMRRRGVAHNDLAKPQNWLMTPEGRAAVIDFQLASVHRRQGRWHRILAYEDLRHLLKQKRNYAKGLLTPKEKQILARRALPSRIWMATAKPLYNYVTRRLLNWSDGEGGEGRMGEDAPALRAALGAAPGVTGVVILPFSLPARGVGLYAFVEGDADRAVLKGVLPAKVPPPEHLQQVPALPRDVAGALREDVLELIATNRVDDLSPVDAGDPLIVSLVAGRLNLTDRALKVK